MKLKCPPHHATKHFFLYIQDYIVVCSKFIHCVVVQQMYTICDEKNTTKNVFHEPKWIYDVVGEKNVFISQHDCCLLYMYIVKEEIKIDEISRIECKALEHSFFPSQLISLSNRLSKFYRIFERFSSEFFFNARTFSVYISK